MKSIKDPEEIRKIEGFKALKLLEKAEKDLVDVMVDVRVNKSHEEIQKRCNMMSDYMAYDGPEEDDTRQPQPDEPEEYWTCPDCQKKFKVNIVKNDPHKFLVDYFFGNKEEVK